MVCPPAPFLVPGLAPNLLAAAGAVAEAGRRAVAGLADVDRVVVLTADARRRRLGPGTRLSGSGFGRSDLRRLAPVTLPGAPPLLSGCPPRRGRVVAGYLLDGAGVRRPTEVVELAPDDADSIAELLCAARDSIGVLAMADGAAAHGPHAPLAQDDRADQVDDDWRQRWPPAIRAVWPPRPNATDLLTTVGVTAGEVFRVLAALPVPQTAAVLAQDAPFGVGYLVATWSYRVGTDVSAVPRLVVVAGPTGTGKSDLALDLAERYSGEVVNGDAMQLYRGMDIGTAKLAPAQRRGIPHHLLDVLDVTETASVAAYQRRARARHRRHPGPGPNADPGRRLGPVRAGRRRRHRLPTDRPGGALALGGRGRATRSGPGPCPAGRAGPPAAAVILRGNARRIARALEVIELTGRPFSATMPRPGAPRFDALLVGLDLDTSGAGRTARRPGRADGGRRSGGRGPDPARPWAPRGAYRVPCVGLSAVRRCDRGSDDDRRGGGVHDPATRRFVRRQRSWFRRDRAGHLVERGPTRSGRRRRGLLASP